MNDHLLAFLLEKSMAIKEVMKVWSQMTFFQSLYVEGHLMNILNEESFLSRAGTLLSSSIGIIYKVWIYSHLHIFQRHPLM